MSYGEHIEEMYHLFRLQMPKSDIKATEIAEEVAGILVAQGQISMVESMDPKFIKQLTSEVKYICNLK